jgi:hypothetical protein
VQQRLRATEVEVGDLVAYYYLLAGQDGLVRGRVLKCRRGKKPSLTIQFEDLSVETKPLKPFKFVLSEDKLLSTGHWCSAELPLVATDLATAIGQYGISNCRSMESDLKIAPHYQVSLPDGRTVYHPVALSTKAPWRKNRLQD